MTILDFFSGGFVVGGSAVADGGDQDVFELKSVLGVGGVRLGCQISFVESAIKPIAASVAGKHASGAVGSVGSGGEPDDQSVGLGIAKVWDGQSPIYVVGKGLALFESDFFAPGGEPGTAGTGYDSVVKSLKLRHGK